MSGSKGSYRRCCGLGFLCCLWVLVLGLVPESNAATVYVGPGEQYTTIQAAIDGVAAGDLIYVRANTYSEQLTITKSLTLQSVDGRDKTIIDGGGTGRVISISDTGKVAVIGFGIRNGGNTGDGGGVHIERATAVTLDQNAISGNNAANNSGGGLYAYRAGVRIKNNLIQNNSAQTASGLYLDGCSGIVTGNTISGNTANDSGGGMSVRNSPLMNISNNTITGNTALQWLGGLGISHCNGVVLRKNIISNNTGQNGVGGLYMENSSSVVVDSNTIAGNNVPAGSNGGAYFGFVSGQFINNKVQDNHASDGVGGLRFDGRCSGLVSGNTITGNQANAVSAMQVQFSDMEIIDNKIMNNTSDAYYVFHVNECPRAVIRRNTISRNTCKNGEGGGIVVGNSSAVTVSGNTISFNKSTGDGAGVRASGADLTLSNNSILNNESTSSGGGIQLSYCTGKVNGNTVMGNKATYGAGMEINFGFYMTISNNIVKSNTAGGEGGGIRLDSCASAILAHNTVSHNTAVEGAGGIYVNGVDATIKDNVIQHNSSGDWGGGIAINMSSVHLVNNIISNNNVKNRGGGVVVQSYSLARLMNNTIVNNIGENGGGGIYCGDYAAAEVVNTILWGNVPVAIYKEPTSKVTTSYCDLPGTAGSTNIHLKPLFVGLGDYHQISTSPSIDKGTATQASTEDIDGQARPQGTGVDIGADEYKSETISILALTPGVAENATTPGKFLISRTDANVSAPLTVAYSVGGTAKPGVDYARLSGIITIPAGKSAVVLNVRRIDNFTNEGDRTLSVTLLAGSGDIGAPGSDVMSILDNEP